MVMVICRAAGPRLTMTTVPCAAAGALPPGTGDSVPAATVAGCAAVAGWVRT